jgi:hypothetical protein
MIKERRGPFYSDEKLAILDVMLGKSSVGIVLVTMLVCLIE